MSLKTKLHISIVGLVAILVAVLSLLNLQVAADVEFQDALEHAQSAARQVQALVLARVTERTAGSSFPAAVETAKREWGRLIREDPALNSLLRQSTANTRAAAAILIFDDRRRVLSASDSSLVGSTAAAVPEFAEWERKGLFGRLREIYSRRRDYAVSASLGLPQTGEALFTVQVLINTVLLRGVVGPQIRALGVVSLIALGLSVLLAALVSNFMLRPLRRISRTIDRITTGEAPAEDPVRYESTEVAALESKLSLLGQQYRGVRKDVHQLRSNIEQLFERLEEAVLLFDADGRLLMAGKPAERFLAKGRWEMMGQSTEELFPTGTLLGQEIETAVQLRRPVKDRPLDLTAAGRTTQVLLSVEPLESYPVRQLIGTLVTLRDVETRRQIESQLDLSSRMAAISRLTGGVAHEIKNPLNAIALHLEVLRSKLERNLPEPEPEIEVIGNEVRRLDRVVKTFLDFTRPVELKLCDVDLCQLAREVLHLVAPECERFRIQTSCGGNGDCPIRADRDLLKQAVLNVVVNAVEAMPDGGKLGLETHAAGREVELLVRDTGPGVPPEIREKIFNLYFSTKKKGSGIGLAMTFQVMQLHNGSIELSSEPGEGTTFRLRFPSIKR